MVFCKWKIAKVGHSNTHLVLLPPFFLSQKNVAKKNDFTQILNV